VIYQDGFQPAVDEAVEQNGPEAVLEVTETVDLLPAEDENSEHGDEHADEADEHAGETTAEHAEHGDSDPHFWLDPARMATLAEEVENQLSELDPDHAADYAARLEDLRVDLTRLDEAYESSLARCEIDTVVVSHDAFGYLERYGVHFEPIAGLSPDAEPSPAHLAQLADLIEEERISTVFSETLASPAMAETLARDLAIETAVLDPIEGLGAATAEEDYLSLMRSNLEQLEAANRCR
jgi:zinc transport system substrate-binding protein